MYSSVYGVAAQNHESSWLTSGAPKLAKVVDAPFGVYSGNDNIDCRQFTFVPPAQTTAQIVCTFDSPFGTLTTGGSLQIGSDSFASLTGPTKQSFFTYSPDPSIAIVSLTSTEIGNYIGIYHNLTKASLQANFVDGRSYYSVRQEPDTMLRDPHTGELLAANTGSAAFSANGEWMLLNLPNRGMLRVHMTDLSVKLFARPIEPIWYLGLAVPVFAISNDGRFVAANANMFATDNLTMYDLTTCDDQLDVAPTKQQFCEGKNIWLGQNLRSQKVGDGLTDQLPSLTTPRHVRFVNDDTISFTAQYTEGESQKSASFTATAPGIVQHKLGLLGMGDSYISGQGAFAYRDGTDTKINPCHLSDLSYPVLLGRQYFDSSNSTACSGATTDKIVGSDSFFEGQVTDGIPESKRDKSTILANFLPGYIYQQEFASTYQPEAILLSVGGDDIGFGGIVKACVANTGGGTCYDTYEDRAELLNKINATYAKLVNTYTVLRQQSGGARLYVVGYPQIAMPGGSCGLNVHLNEEEVIFSAQLISYLDNVIRQAAQTAGVFYVDTEHAFDGHRMCEPGDKAINGLTAGGDSGVTVLGHTINFIGAESYHPTVLGYRLLADTISRQTADLTAVTPASGPYDVPSFDPTVPILQNVSKTGRKLSLITNDYTISDDLMFRGGSEQVSVNGAEAQLQPGSDYQVVLHSNPVQLGEGSVDAAGNIAATVTVPADVPTGYHTLHVHSTNMAGEPVDVQKVVYVAANADDYDGDGVSNTVNLCMIVPSSGQDMDRDGIDDACDPDVDTQSLGTATTDKISVDHGVSSSSIQGGNTSSSISARPRTTAVLGDTVAISTLPARQPSVSVLQSPRIQKLFRLNWLVVLEVGFGITVITTGLYYSVRRR